MKTAKEAIKSSKWPKCPKCKSQDVVIVELWKNHGIVWFYGDGFDDGILDAGEPYKVEGSCRNCSHKWKFREIIQIKAEWFGE